MPRAYNDPTADAAIGHVMKEELQKKKRREYLESHAVCLGIHSECLEHPNIWESRRAKWKKSHPGKGQHTFSVWQEKGESEQKPNGGEHDAGK